MFSKYIASELLLCCKYIFVVIFGGRRLVRPPRA